MSELISVTDSQDNTERVTAVDVDSFRMPPSIPDLSFEATVTLENANVLREWLDDLKEGAVTIVASSQRRPGSHQDDNESLTFEHKVNESDDDDDSPSESDYTVKDTLVVDGVSIDDWGVASNDPLPGAYHSDVALEEHEPNSRNYTRVRGYYSVDYLKKWCKRLRKTRVDDVAYTLEFGDEWPLRLTRDDETGALVQFLLAPRIVN